MLTALEANPDGEHTPRLTQRQKAPCGIPACTSTPAWASYSEGQAGGNRSVRVGSAHSSRGQKTSAPTRGSGGRARGRGSGRGCLQRQPRGPRLHRPTEHPPTQGPGPPAARSAAGTFSLSRKRKETGISGRRAQQRNEKSSTAGTAPLRRRPPAGSAPPPGHRAAGPRHPPLPAATRTGRGLPGPAAAARATAAARLKTSAAGGVAAHGRSGGRGAAGVKGAGQRAADVPER